MAYRAGQIVHCSSGNVLRIESVAGDRVRLSRIAVALNGAFRTLANDWWGIVEWHVSSLRDAELLCDYCECRTATGYVKAYDAHVCRPCYDDHHGRGCE